VRLRLGKIRPLDTNFAFTIQLHERDRPLEVLCDSEELARIRIRALRASERARRAALRSFTRSGSGLSNTGR
jgi:hypothetical protein